MTPLLEIDHLSMAFRQRSGFLSKPRLIPAVIDCSVSVSKGEVLGIVGESGSGKSTLAKLVLRLLTPNTGQIRIDGSAIDTVGPREFAELVQPVFQDPYSSLNPKQPLSSIIAMPLAVRGVRRAEREARARDMLDRVGLPARLFRSYPNQLSGGQRQRVAIARALVSSPRLLVCDEPTSALDVSVQAQILELLDEIKQSFGLTYLFISHNLAVVERVATRVAVMYRGRIVEQGPSGSFFSTPRHPYSQMLLNSILPPVVGRPLPNLAPTRRSTIAEDAGAGCPFRVHCPIASEICEQAPPVMKTADGMQVACHKAAQPLTERGQALNPIGG